VGVGIDCAVIGLIKVLWKGRNPLFSGGEERHQPRRKKHSIRKKEEHKHQRDRKKNKQKNRSRNHWGHTKTGENRILKTKKTSKSTKKKLRPAKGAVAG